MSERRGNPWHMLRPLAWVAGLVALLLYEGLLDAVTEERLYSLFADVVIAVLLRWGYLKTVRKDDPDRPIASPWIAVIALGILFTAGPVTNLEPATRAARPVATPSPIFVNTSEIFVPLEGYRYEPSEEALVAEIKAGIAEKMPAGAVESVEARSMFRSDEKVADAIVIVADSGLVDDSFEAGVVRGFGAPSKATTMGGYPGHVAVVGDLAAYFFLRGNALIETIGDEGRELARVTRRLLAET